MTSLSDLPPCEALGYVFMISFHGCQLFSLPGETESKGGVSSQEVKDLHLR